MSDTPLPKLLVVMLASGEMMVQAASALITIDTVPVGNAGNAADNSSGFGAVGYNYGIGKYEVTINQYTAFLNAVGGTDTYGLYNFQMGSREEIMGISRNGVSGSYTYSALGSGNRPITYVSWFDSARFVNWLHNGQPTGAQSASTTETGAYTLNGALSGIFTRNANAIYGLPNENEWYKAAYYQPATQGGDSDNYWLYPTRSNLAPNNSNGSNSDPNSANFQSAVNDVSGNKLTEVGAFGLATGFYGTFDQGGNVYEWNDATIGSTRGLRGGSWGTQGNYLSSSIRNSSFPAIENIDVGFRVVIVPEPSVAAFAALGTFLLVWRRAVFS